ncbi:DUF3486 family protein [Orbaceae bacterium ac157xtp]
MGRKSTIHKLEPEVRTYIEKLLRADQLTLDEMIVELQDKFPSTDTPSRSSLHRYQKGFNEMAASLKEIDVASRVLVDELGEGVGDKAGALLAQLVTTLTAKVAFKAHENDDITISEIADLSRAARAAMQARTMSLKERQEIEKATREKLIREQKEKLDELGKTGEVPAEMLAKVIKAAYDL